MTDNGNGNGKPGKNGITAAEAIEAAKGSRGFVTTIAKHLGCSRCYVYQLNFTLINSSFNNQILESTKSMA